MAPTGEPPPLVTFVRRAARALRRRALPALLRLPPVRARLRRRALAAWADAGTVAFVCLGNICRSPFAELLAAASAPDGKAFHSAGSFPRSGRRSPEAAVEAAALWDVDLGPHRSRVLTPELVDGADAIFVFDADNRRRLASAHPAARAKVHYLGALAPRGPVVIHDPFGGSVGAFRSTYRQIADSLAAARDARA